MAGMTDGRAPLRATGRKRDGGRSRCPRRWSSCVPGGGRATPTGRRGARAGLPCRGGPVARRTGRSGRRPGAATAALKPERAGSGYAPRSGSSRPARTPRKAGRQTAVTSARPTSLSSRRPPVRRCAPREYTSTTLRRSSGPARVAGQACGRLALLSAPKPLSVVLHPHYATPFRIGWHSATLKFVPLLLVRHAQAKPRKDWGGDDGARPLSLMVYAKPKGWCDHG